MGLMSLAHLLMLACPFPQEWPERYTVDAFGGKRELGESSLEAAVRETREESGGALRLDDARCFARLPALDMRCARS